MRYDNRTRYNNIAKEMKKLGELSLLGEKGWIVNMNEKEQAVREMLKKHGQEQLLACYTKMDKNKQEKLLDEILTIDFPQIEKLYGKSIQKEVISSASIEPISYIEKDKIEQEEKQKLLETGEKLIKEGKYAVVTMAGGQGTRLGHNGPKGTYDLGLESHKSIFEILCDTLKEAQRQYGVYVPWYIMTSRQNHTETVEFFEKHSYFGYPKQDVFFFMQGELPVVNEKGKILLNTEGLVNQAADGHGGIFVSMRKNGVIYDMKARGIQWAFIGGVDNVLAKMVDPILVGLCMEKKVLAGGKSVVKACPEERVGVFCRRNGRPSVVEYTEISKEMSEEREENGELKYGESHILCNIFHIDAIEEISKDKLPYHSAHKKIEYMDSQGNIVKPTEPNAYKYEAFLFDAFESLEDMAIMRVKREEEFAPVKNATGVDSPETARKLYKAFHGIE